MKRKANILTSIASVGVVAMVLTACGASEQSTTQSATSKAQTTVTTTEETTTTTTTTEETTATTTVETTTKPAETTTVTTVKPAETTVVTTEPQPEWTEEKYTAQLYTNTACYSRKTAIQGSATVNSYDINTKVNIIAKTSTGYCKLDDGSFIHSDFLSKSKTEVTDAPKKEEGDYGKTESGDTILGYTGDGYAIIGYDENGQYYIGETTIDGFECYIEDWNPDGSPVTFLKPGQDCYIEDDNSYVIIG